MANPSNGSSAVLLFAKTTVAWVTSSGPAMLQQLLSRPGCLRVNLPCESVYVSQFAVRSGVGVAEGSGAMVGWVSIGTWLFEL